MNKEEKLQKILKRAVDNGYKTINPEPKNNKYEYYPIIFDIEFAKCFFGEEDVCPICGRILKDDEEDCEDCEINFVDFELDIPYCWQYHLQELAISEDRIEYLYKFIETK